MKVKVVRANGQETIYPATGIVLEEELIIYQGTWSFTVATIDIDGQWLDEDGFCVFVTISD